MAEVSVKLLGLWGSPFTLRVKCVFQNQYVEEGLSNKNAMLLQYNPKDPIKSFSICQFA
ncbi:hypothetical protein DEO72_LG11g2934 [Vigna unguiculata]|uniref:Glutathione S-transferase n=1 Tax=Vigna unguiculata TaxID=3917 RepID=A0A4D6NSK9_VIGUN|nr:hypothetical protein DEO72_LG11g2934 [Vigna unguiculata]